MTSNASWGNGGAWTTRAEQARRVAAMLSPRDAALAEAYAMECEDRARRNSTDVVRSVLSPDSQVLQGPMPTIRRSSVRTAA
ncbi:hypothetical protein ACVMIH_002350 [Bradyrhizobium sp. USDA 4503]